MNGLTRHQAAVALGVTDQTITNYCKSGLLGYCKGERNILYVNAEDVEKYKKQLKMIYASELLIKAKQRQLDETRRELTKKEVELRSALKFHAKIYDRDFFVRILTNFFNSGMIIGMKPREKDMLCDFIGGNGFKEIGEKYALSIARVQQVINNAASRLEDTAEISEEMRANYALEQENKELKREIAMLREKYEKDDDSHDDELKYITTLLSTKLVDLNLSVRALNCLCSKGGMETLGDLLCTPQRNIMAIRDFGKKTFSEIEDVIEGLNLDWRMDGETDVDFYDRLINHRKGVGEWT